MLLIIQYLGILDRNPWSHCSILHIWKCSTTLHVQNVCVELHWYLSLIYLAWVSQWRAIISHLFGRSWVSTARCKHVVYKEKCKQHCLWSERPNRDDQSYRPRLLHQPFGPEQIIYEMYSDTSQHREKS